MKQKEDSTLKNMNDNKPILAIETSENLCGVSLYFSEKEYYSSTINLKHSHSEKLFEIIQFLFSTANIGNEEINAIAVSAGPGSFTGLRIGMAAAKGIATGAGVPIYIVPTFEALAYQLSFELENGSTFIIANKVNKDEVYYAKFQIKSNNYIFVEDLTILTNIKFTKRVNGTKVFGNTPYSSVGELNNSLCSPSPEFIAKWAMKFGKERMTFDFDYLEPLYIKTFNVKKRQKK
ncbi:MAG: tRNA (adenosine(37)-N6)-threonylcarbamoyltransferase complex dimerization subunit type 1 TsaB [Ignavibacteriaceae bacterium]